MLFESTLKIQAKDTGKFAATTRSDASVFWFWLTSVVPPVSVERSVGANGELTMESELMEFELTLLILIGQLLKVCNDAVRNACMDWSREVPDQHLSVCTYIDTLRYGRNYTPTKSVMDLSTFLSREDFGKKNLKYDSKTMYQVQDTSPDVAYSPFEQSHDWEAHNRFTIARKLRLLLKSALLVGEKITIQ